MTSQAADQASVEVEQLASDLCEVGLVVLPVALAPEFVVELRDAFWAVLERHLAQAPPNRGPQRHQVYLPFEAPFSDQRLWGDPTVLEVVGRVLGDDFECTYYGSDTPFPGSEHQPVHQDGGPLFPEWAERPPPYCVALNVPLVDVDEANGPFEWFSGHDRPSDDAVANRVTGPAGSMLLRDTRTWHRGSPNVGDAPRPMLALLYTRPWYRFVLDRPATGRSDYEALPEVGRRLFRGAEITPRERASGDQPRLGRPS